MSVNNDFYKESGELSPYDLLLELKKPEVAGKITKLKLHEKGVFEREFWEDLELSKGAFPALRKISIAGVAFNLLNLKFFKNTLVESFNFRNTCINELRHIGDLLQAGKRVIISNEMHMDTATMALWHAIDTNNYTFVTWAMQSGSWSKKNAEMLAQNLLSAATNQKHFESLQKWAEDLVLPNDAPACIKDAVLSIKHPLITLKIIDGEEVTETLLSHPYVMSNPVLKMFYTEFNDESSNCIEIRMSQECFENLKKFELTCELAEGIGAQTLIEMAHIAEMYEWNDLKDSLIKYNITAEWDDEEYADDYEKLEAILDLLPSIPEFMRQPVLDQAFAAFDLDKIKVEKNTCIIAFHVTLIQILKKLPISYNVNLAFNISDLDPSSLELLQENGPYNNVSYIHAKSSDSGLLGVWLKEMIMSMAPAFPACKQMLMELDFRSYPVGLELEGVDLAFNLNIDFAHLNISAMQTILENAPYDKVKKLVLKNTSKHLPGEFITMKIKQFAGICPSCDELHLDDLGYIKGIWDSLNAFKRGTKFLFGKF